MNADLTASEKRLIAALDRIDQFIDRAGAARQAPPDAAADAAAAEAEEEAQRLATELAALRDSHAAALAEFEARLAASEDALSHANDRLAAAGEEAARLAMANEALAEANRRLIGPPGPEPDEIRRALEAEVDALRQARAAEIGQIGDIVDTLDRMIGDQGGADDQPGSEADPLAPADTGPAVIETPVTMSPASTAQVGQGGDAQMADETDQERG